MERVDHYAKARAAMERAADLDPETAQHHDLLRIAALHGQLAQAVELHRIAKSLEKLEYLLR